MRPARVAAREPSRLQTPQRGSCSLCKASCSSLTKQTFRHAGAPRCPPLSLNNWGKQYRRKHKPLTQAGGLLCKRDRWASCCSHRRVVLPGQGGEGQPEDGGVVRGTARPSPRDTCHPPAQRQQRPACACNTSRASGPGPGASLVLTVTA